MPSVPGGRAQQLVDTIYRLFFHGCTWPRFVDLDRFLDRRGEPDSEAILLAMPPGLVYGISPHQPTIQDEQELALTVAAMASCDQASEDLRVFLSAVRHAADLEHALEPGQPAAQISSDTITRSVVLSAAGRQDLLARLGEILRVEDWGWSNASHGDGQWSFVIDRRVRRLRGVTTIEDYWNRAHRQALSDAGTPGPDKSSAEDGMADADDQLSIFISYSHADKPVAAAIARALESAGARVWIDEGELRAGDSIIERIATAIIDVHFVVAVVSETSVGSGWCKKELALALTEGLGREGVKLLPLRLGQVAMPASLTDVYYRQVDPADPAAIAAQLMEDARSHRSARQTEPRSRRGAARTASANRARHPTSAAPGSDPWSGVTATGFGNEVVRQARQTGVTPAEYARRGLTRGNDDRPGPIAERGPVTLTGIVREGVGRPRDDGTRGSALYAVPFRLSQVPTNDWARLLEQTWDTPPEWTTMHRPGICSVQRDVVTLDGVTIEEVERYHLKTLKLCVTRANEETDRQERARDAARDRERQDISEHESSVADAIERLEFD